MKILTTVAAALLSSVAMAQVQPPTSGLDPAEAPIAQATFESLDRNKDQRVSKVEAAADDGLSAQFAAVDADADGYINKGEYMRSQQSAPPPLPNPDPAPPVPDPS
jgi:hypothetical protein